MALNLASKAPTGVLRYSWTPPALPGDAVSGATLVRTSGTVAIDSYGLDGDSVYFFASGGTLGETTVITATATTSEGETLVETLYLPVRTTSNAFSYTVADVLRYALRPIVGIGATPTADEFEDARENLDDMLASWAERGAALGVRLPTVTADVLYIPDALITAVKANLRVRLCELYSRPITSVDAMNARSGMILVTHRNLPEDRPGVYF